MHWSQNSILRHWVLPSQEAIEGKFDKVSTIFADVLGFQVDFSDFDVTIQFLSIVDL